MRVPLFRRADAPPTLDDNPLAPHTAAEVLAALWALEQGGVDHNVTVQRRPQPSRTAWRVWVGPDWFDVDDWNFDTTATSAELAFNDRVITCQKYGWAVHEDLANARPGSVLLARSDEVDDIATMPPTLLRRAGFTPVNRDIHWNHVPTPVETPKVRNLYLSGPMRGIPAFNFPEFDRAAALLRNVGYQVFSPAERDKDIGFDPTGMDGNEDLAALGFNLRDALGADMAWITQHADAVIVLPGWVRSSGARAEAATAAALGLPVYRLDEFLEMGPDYHVDYSVDVVETVGSQFAGTLMPPPTDRMWIFDEPRDELDTKTMDGETRVVNATTGGAKGSKLARFDLLPAGPLRQLAEHYGKGSLKYDDRNWERGYDWSLSFAALMRHAWQFWNGEDIDEETGTPHPIAVAWHALALAEFMDTHTELDDRATTAEVAA